MNTTHKSVVARITGRVQGVWFRGWTRQEAGNLGITGWVRNEPDGSVTALLQGPPADIDAMTDLLWLGPPSAQVANVSTEVVEKSETCPDFTVRR